MLGGGQAQVAGPGHSGAVGHGAGRIGGAVRAVGAAAERGDTLGAVQLHGRGQGELLVAAALALAPDGHRGLAAADDAGRRFDGLTCGRHLLGDGRVHAGHVAGLAGDARRQDQGAVPQLSGRLLCRLQGQGVVAHHEVVGGGEGLVPGSRGFLQIAGRPGFQALAHGRGQALEDVVLPGQVQAVAKGGGVGVRGARSDGVEPVADNVGDHQRHHRSRPGQASQLAALYPGQMLAHGVHLVDGGAAFQQEPSGGLLLLQGDALGRGRHEGGAAPGEQAQNQGTLVQPLEQVEHGQGAGHAGLVGDGVAALGRGEALQGQRVAVLGVDGAGADGVAEDLFRGDGHGGGGLARAQDHQAGHLVQRQGQVADLQLAAGHGESATNTGGRVGGPDGCFEDAQGVGAADGRRVGGRHGDLQG